MSQMEAMKRFMVMQSPFFVREPDAELVKIWLMLVKRMFYGLDIPKDRRVGLVAHMLGDRVDFWWETMKRAHNIEVMTWDQFERILCDKY